MKKIAKQTSFTKASTDSLMQMISKSILSPHFYISTCLLMISSSLSHFYLIHTNPSPFSTASFPWKIPFSVMTGSLGLPAGSIHNQAGWMLHESLWFFFALFLYNQWVLKSSQFFLYILFYAWEEFCLIFQPMPGKWSRLNVVTCISATLPPGEGQRNHHSTPSDIFSFYTDMLLYLSWTGKVCWLNITENKLYFSQRRI